jgi:hypothetical protein
MSITVMTLLSALLTLIFFGVLAFALIKLHPVLASIGGTPTSYLAKLRFGLRAIEARPRTCRARRPASTSNSAPSREA